MSGGSRHSFLAQRFQEFYREVMRLKRRIDRGAWVFEGKEEEEEADRSAPTMARQRLVTLLERQSLSAVRSGGDFAEGIYRRAQYVMAALADEIFLNLAWGGAEAWRSQLLESKLFHTHHAGEEIFVRIDRLLAARDPIYLDLAEIYLRALALGFQGKYRDRPAGAEHLARYRGRLLDFLAERDPELRSEAIYLFPSAYASTLDQGGGRRLPYMRRWLVAAGIVVGLWVLAGHVAWTFLVDDVRPMIDWIVSPG